MHRHNSFKSQGITVHWFSAQSCMEWAWDDEQRKHEYAGKTIGKWIRNLSQVRDLQVANPSRKEFAFPQLPSSIITTVQSIFHSVQDQRHRNGNNQKENSMVRNATHCHVTTFYCMFFSGKWSCSHFESLSCWR